MKTKLAALLTGLLLSLAHTAQADMIEADFTELNGLPSTSAGHIKFNLNNNGTVAATFTTTLHSFLGLAYNAPGAPTQSNFSNPDAISSGWGTAQYGSFESGIACNRNDATVNCLENMSGALTWTIGNLGDFSSVWQILGGASSHDFYLVNWTEGAAMPSEWVADIGAISVPVPEPTSAFLMLIGLACFVQLRRHANT